MLAFWKYGQLCKASVFACSLSRNKSLNFSLRDKLDLPSTLSENLDKPILSPADNVVLNSTKQDLYRILQAVLWGEEKLWNKVPKEKPLKPC